MCQQSQNPIITTPKERTPSKHGGLNKAKQIKKPSQGNNQNPDLHKMPPFCQKRIIINTLKSEYPLIDEVASKEMNWRVSKDANQDFDVYWSDLGIEP